VDHRERRGRCGSAASSLGIRSPASRPARIEHGDLD
jgi:hypothetical protein